MNEPAARSISRPAATASLPISAVLFDLGDVLYDATLWRRWLLQTLGRLGLHAHYRSLFCLWDRDYLEAVHRGERDYDEAFRAFLADVGLSPAQIEEVEAASRTQRRQIAQSARPLPGVRTTLERLTQMELQLAVVSDSESSASELHGRLHRWGLGNHFSLVVSSRDLGCCKPDPRCYLAALDPLAISPQRAAFVGHDDEELAGAKALGLRTVAFNYECGARADAYLQSFTALGETLRAWNHTAAAA